MPSMNHPSSSRSGRGNRPALPASALINKLRKKAEILKSGSAYSAVKLTSNPTFLRRAVLSLRPKPPEFQSLAGHPQSIGISACAVNDFLHNPGRFEDWRDRVSSLQSRLSRKKNCCAQARTPAPTRSFEKPVVDVLSTPKHRADWP